VAVSLVEAAKDVEDQDPVLHGPAKVTEGVCHGLHLPAVLANGEVALDEGAEACVETQGPGFGVAQELALERQPGPAGGALRGAADEVVKVEGDGPQDPREDDAVETQPRRGPSRRRGVGEDVVV